MITATDRFSIEKAINLRSEAFLAIREITDRAQAISVSATTLDAAIQTQQEDRSSDAQQDVVNAARELSTVLNDDSSQIRNSLASAESYVYEHGLPATVSGRAPW